MSALATAIVEGLEAQLAHQQADAGGPFAKYYSDPVGFFVDVLGIVPWHIEDSDYDTQRDVVETIAVSERVTVRSGHGVGKTRLAAGIVLWFVMTRGGGCRAFLTATKGEQAEQGVWRELRLLFLGAKVNFADHGWVLPKLGKTGLEGPELQQVIVVTSDTAEGFQGLRAPEMILVADEASGIDERIFVAMEANLSGGGKFLLIGNPTKAEGYFYEANRSPAWTRKHIPSTATPNVLAGRIVIKGLVTREWCEKREEDWGASSALYRIRVLGEHVEQQVGKLFPLEVIERAEKIGQVVEGTGRTNVGIDPAGEGGEGDESAFCTRRGQKCYPIVTRRGLSPEGHVLEALGQVALHGRDHDPPRFIVDVSGVPGAKVYAAFLGYLAKAAADNPAGLPPFELYPIRPSDHAKRRPFEVDKMRDELWFNLVDAIREGLGISPDVQLEGDLSAQRFDRMNAGRAKVLSKEQVRRELGRSPDKGDALCLAAWEPIDQSSVIEAQLRAAEEQARNRDEEKQALVATAGGALDPYAGQGGGDEGEGGIDPYEGADGGWRRR